MPAAKKPAKKAAAGFFPAVDRIFADRKAPLDEKGKRLNILLASGDATSLRTAAVKINAKYVLGRTIKDKTPVTALRLMLIAMLKQKAVDAEALGVAVAKNKEAKAAKAKDTKAKKAAKAAKAVTDKKTAFAEQAPKVERLMKGPAANPEKALALNL